MTKSKTANKVLSKLERLTSYGHDVTIKPFFSDIVVSWSGNHAHKSDSPDLNFGEWLDKVLPDPEDLENEQQ